MHSIYLLWVASIPVLQHIDRQGAPPNRHLGATRRRGLNIATPGSSPLSIQLGMRSAEIGNTKPVNAKHTRRPNYRIVEEERERNEVGLTLKMTPETYGKPHSHPCRRQANGAKPSTWATTLAPNQAGAISAQVKMIIHFIFSARLLLFTFYIFTLVV